MKKIPKSLRVWFIIHFVADYLFGIPLLLFPVWTLNLFGFTAVETVTARLFGAALLGIGGVSLLTHKKGKESYDTLLSLKLIWSLAAIIGLIISIIQGSPKATWLILLTFIIFNGIWLYYKKTI
tara:strand:- start:227 stop:598 length:372 start_codon:yes stop_codon:yes gene_type:complete